MPRANNNKNKIIQKIADEKRREIAVVSSSITLWHVDWWWKLRCCCIHCGLALHRRSNTRIVVYSTFPLP
jgi:hypothetical protein